MRCVLEQGHEGRCEYKGRLFGESRCLAKEERFVYKGQYSHTIEVQCSGARGHSGTVHWHRGKKFAGQIDFPG